MQARRAYLHACRLRRARAHNCARHHPPCSLSVQRAEPGSCAAVDRQERARAAAANGYVPARQGGPRARAGARPRQHARECARAHASRSRFLLSSLARDLSVLFIAPFPFYLLSGLLYFLRRPPFPFLFTPSLTFSFFHALSRLSQRSLVYVLILASAPSPLHLRLCTFTLASIPRPHITTACPLPPPSQAATLHMPPSPSTALS
eukprot:5583823-Pleurochrysis_carterae.AAC.3